MKRQKKNVAKVLSVCLAGALTCTGILPVFAGDEAAEKEERDRLVVYLDNWSSRKRRLSWWCSARRQS